MTISPIKKAPCTGTARGRITRKVASPMAINSPKNRQKTPDNKDQKLSNLVYAGRVLTNDLDNMICLISVLQDSIPDAEGDAANVSSSFLAAIRGLENIYTEFATVLSEAGEGVA